MNLLDLLLVAVALAMDALAVAVSSGIAADSPGWKNIVKLGAFFGFFQFFMPVIGWLLGRGVSAYIEQYDHWVAFGLLAFIGVRMVIEAIRENSGDEGVNDPFATKTLFLMAIATSIDALAVGISFALASVNIWSSSITIGVVTFFLSVLGVLIGKKVGALFKRGSGILAGLILIGIGVKILIEHMAA